MTKVYIWNAHWMTLGGGEVYAATLAEVLLSEGFEVHIIGYSETPLDAISQRLGIDLRGIKYIRINNEAEISKYLGENDVFINGSFGSNFSAPVKKSVYIVHFPTGAQSRFKQRLIHKFLNLSVQEKSGRQVFLTNIYDVLIGSGRIEISKSNNVILSCLSGSVSIQERNRISHSLDSGESISLSGPKQLSIIDSGKTSSVLRVNSNKKVSKVLQILRNRIYLQNHFLLSYAQFWSNSVFTANYVRKMWDRDSEVVYPPVLEQLPGNATRNPYQIISVGRFMSPRQGHCKNQHQLIRAFEELCRTTDKPWELHLCGGVDGKNDQYFRSVMKKSEESKLNIHIHPNVEKDVLVALTASSSYYWHATGLGVSSNKPHKLEHFGITVVEAMKGGMIPIVHNSAGPAEILKDFPNLMFKTIGELAHMTQTFSTLSSELLELERNRLLDVSKKFTVQNFKYDVLSHISEL